MCNRFVVYIFKDSLKSLYGNTWSRVHKRWFFSLMTVPKLNIPVSGNRYWQHFRSSLHHTCQSPPPHPISNVTTWTLNSLDQTLPNFILDISRTRHTADSLLDFFLSVLHFSDSFLLFSNHTVKMYLADLTFHFSIVLHDMNIPKCILLMSIWVTHSRHYYKQCCYKLSNTSIFMNTCAGCLCTKKNYRISSWITELQALVNNHQAIQFSKVVWVTMF